MSRSDKAVWFYPGVAVALVGAVVAAALIFKYAPAPFALLGLLGGLLGFALAAWLRGWRQTAGIAAASLLLAVGIGETVASFLLRTPAVVQSEVAFSEPDPGLGWRNAAGVTSQVTRLIADQRLYSVRYSIDDRGRRVAPPDRGANAEACVLFFADSFTFGEGVNDAETYPYRVGVRTAGRARTINLAVNGHGPHQMLRQLEQDEFAPSLPCTPTHVLYLALPHHVMRVVGKALRGGPTYVLRDGGAIALADPTAKATRQLFGSERLERIAQRSTMLRMWHQREPMPTAADLNLYFAVVKQAGAVIARRWPTAERHVLAWNLHERFAERFDRFRARLAETPWQVHDIVETMPGYTRDPVPYSLHRSDLHPNAAAHDLVAAYVVGKILHLPVPGAVRP